MKIGFIGLGLMGKGMAGNLRKAGHQMLVHDLRHEAAEPLLGDMVAWADSPRVVAEQCDVIFTSLPKPADVEAVLHATGGLAEGLRAGTIWLDLSTNAVDAVRRLSAELAERDVVFMDAPVSGGPAGAASGKLAVWIGGPKAAFDTVKPLLDAMSDSPRYIGESGAGTIAKLVHNLASAALNQLLAETMTIGVKAGLDPLSLFEAVRGGALGRMRTFDPIARRWLTGTIDTPSFALELQHKDVKLAVELAREVGVPARLSNLAYEELVEAMNRGWARRDAQSVLQLQQERAGVDPMAVPLDAVEEVLART